MSSQDFNAILTNLENALEEIAKSYVSEYTTYITQASELLTTIQKYPEFVQETGVDEFTELELTDAVQTATEIVDAANNSPVVAEILSQIEEEFGISARTPLALAQTLMQGSDSNLLKVVVSLVLFDQKMGSLSTAVHTIYNAIVGINTFLATYPALTGELDLESEIPTEIITRLETARNELQKSLSSPFNVNKYMYNMDEVKGVAQELEDFGIFKNVVDAVGNIAIKMVLDSSFTTISSSYGLLKKAAEDCKATIDIIKNTDTTVRTQNNARFVSAQKAVRRISGILAQMRKEGVQQGAMIAKYVVALNVAYTILKAGRPLNDSSITLSVMDVSGIVVTAEEIDAMLATCRKILRATQSPRKLVAIGNEISTLSAQIAQFDAHVNLSNSAIDAIAIEYAQAFQVARTVIDLIAGLDFAKQLLTVGEYDGFFSLSEASGTGPGAAKQALQSLADACDKVSLTKQAAYFRQKAKEIEKQEREMKSKLNAKKEKKKSKIVQQIEMLNKISTELSDLITTGIGTVQGIASVIN